MSEASELPGGRAIPQPPHFFIGFAETPLAPAPDWQPQRLIDKIDAGAQFVQTQFCYDIAVLRAYLDRLRAVGVTERCFVLAGTGPIVSARSAR